METEWQARLAERDAYIAQQDARLARQDARIAELEALVLELQARFGNAREKVHRKRYRGFAPLQHYGFGVRPAFPPRLLSRWLSPANSNTLP